jgi:hypothetical protein
LALGTIGAAPGLAIVHVLVLVAILALGSVWAFRTVERRLIRG